MKKYHGESDAILLRAVNYAVESRRNGAGYDINNDNAEYANCPNKFMMKTARYRYYDLDILDQQPMKRGK